MFETIAATVVCCAALQPLEAAPAQQFVQADVLSVNTTSAPPLATSGEDGFQDQIAREVFRRIGVSISIEVVPGERSLRNLNSGVDDATFVRIEGIEKAYPNLVRVPEKVMDWSFVAFSTDPAITINSWEDLTGRTVAYMNGWMIFEANTTHLANTITTSNPENLFTLLKRGRTEVVLFEKWSGLHLVRQLNITGVAMHTPPLAMREMYMYVH